LVVGSCSCSWYFPHYQESDVIKGSGSIASETCCTEAVRHRWATTSTLTGIVTVDTSSSARSPQPWAVAVMTMLGLQVPEEETGVLVLTGLQSSSATRLLVTHSVAVASSASQPLQSRCAAVSSISRGKVSSVHSSICLSLSHVLSIPSHP
jgi:hypothetical protein